MKKISKTKKVIAALGLTAAAIFATSTVATVSSSASPTTSAVDISGCYSSLSAKCSSIAHGTGLATTCEPHFKKTAARTGDPTKAEYSITFTWPGETKIQTRYYTYYCKKVKDCGDFYCDYLKKYSPWFFQPGTSTARF